MYVFTEQPLEKDSLDAKCLEPSVSTEAGTCWIRVSEDFQEVSYTQKSLLGFRFVGIPVIRVYEQHPASVLLFPPESAVLEMRF